VLRPHLFGFDLSALAKMDFLTGWYYYYVFALFVIATWGMWRIVSSPFGLALKALRDNPKRPPTSEIDVRRSDGMHSSFRSLRLSRRGPGAPGHRNVDPTLTYWTQSGTLVFHDPPRRFCELSRPCSAV